MVIYFSDFNYCPRHFECVCVQHEIDHLDGVLFPMRMTDLSMLTFNEELKNFMEYAMEQDAGADDDADADEE